MGRDVCPQYRIHRVVCGRVLLPEIVTGYSTGDTDDKKEEDVTENEPNPEEEEVKKENDYEELKNLSRITPSQSRYIQFKSDSRYRPVKKVI